MPIFSRFGADFSRFTPISEKFQKDTGNALRALPGIPLESAAGNPPKLYNSRHLRLPEHFQYGCLFFQRGGSGEGLPELVMEFPAVPRVFLHFRTLRKLPAGWTQDVMSHC